MNSGSGAMFPGVQPPVLQASMARTIIAVLPVACCFLLPLVQIHNLIYFYDFLIILSLPVLGFPALPRGQQDRLFVPWIMLVAAVLIGCLSALARAGPELRPFQYTTQYLLSLLYFRSLYMNIVSGRIDLPQYARFVAFAGIALSGIAITQYILFQVRPSLASRLYIDYVTFAGQSSYFFEARYLRQIELKGAIRAIGTWDVATTFGGMLALASAFLIFARISYVFKMLFFTTFALAILMTSSRHAWVVAIIVMFAIMSGSLLKRIAIGSGAALLLFAYVGYVASIGGGQGGPMTLDEQLTARVDRTVEEGADDSSVKGRYIIGTERFFRYGLVDPSIFVVGYGIGTEKATIDDVGISAWKAMEGYHQFGFVSNGWLLIWRNWGIFGFVGLIVLFVGQFRIGSREARYGLVIAALIIAADNYSIHVARCFFLIFTFIAVCAAHSALAGQTLPAEQPLVRRPLLPSLAKPPYPDVRKP